MSEVALNPSNVMAHAFLSNTLDPDAERPFFEGDFADFINWAIGYAIFDAYGLKAAMITTGQGKYQKMKQMAQVGRTTRIDPNIGGITTIV